MGTHDGGVTSATFPDIWLAWPEARQNGQGVPVIPGLAKGRLAWLFL